MKNFELAIVGNGILALISALFIKKNHPNDRIAIIGEFSKPNSASVAAGAMHAVYCEIEGGFENSERDQDFFTLGLKARSEWLELIKEYSLDEVITAQDTIMYCRKSGTEFEKENFKTACEIAERDRCLEDVSVRELQSIFNGILPPDNVRARKFLGEFSIDANLLFSKLETLLQISGVEFINYQASKIQYHSDCTSLDLGQVTIKAGRVLIAAGSETSRLVPEGFPMIPIYRGVGTAILLDRAPPSYNSLNAVVRTPNRGGAQCGLHIVPRTGNKFYVGAGNYFTNDLPAHRIETVRYLTDRCEQELFGKTTTYLAKAEFLLGSRPKSLDGLPVIGNTQDFSNLFVATGTYRVGLTLAPVIGKSILSWYDNGVQDAQFCKWRPDRIPSSYASMEMAQRYYSESRIANLIEHGLLNENALDAVKHKRDELIDCCMVLNKKIVEENSLPVGFVIDPDMYTVLSDVTTDNIAPV